MNEELKTLLAEATKQKAIVTDLMRDTDHVPMWMAMELIEVIVYLEKLEKAHTSNALANVDFTA